MTTTAVIFSSKCLKHNPGIDHPESPTRLKTIMKELKRWLKTERCTLIEPKPASLQDLKLVHKPNYIQLVKRRCLLGKGALNSGDTIVCKESYDAAIMAAGGALTAVNLVMEGKFQNAFALVRPPGHHAGPDHAMGFCIFNNAALAATHLLQSFNLTRVAILDIDAHHGNGTQSIFYNTRNVLYISLHQDPRSFPKTGFAEEIGEGEGRGYTVNIPLPLLTSDYIYLKAFDSLVTPILKQYKPQFLIISAGFDGHYTDPIGKLRLSALTYSKIFDKILNLASKLCGNKLTAILEGGYSLDFLGKLVTLAIAKMAGFSYNIKDTLISMKQRNRRKAEETLKNLKEIHSSFWKL